MLHISQAIAFSYRHPFHGTDSIIFQRIINYAQLHPQTGDTLHTNCYTSYHMKTDRRNVALPLVPTMSLPQAGQVPILKAGSRFITSASCTAS